MCPTSIPAKAHQVGFGDRTVGRVVFLVGARVERGKPVDHRLQVVAVIDTRHKIGIQPVAEINPLSPVSARMMNSWLMSPPIGPVSASIGIAVSPMRANVFR